MPDSSYGARTAIPESPMLVINKLMTIVANDMSSAKVVLSSRLNTKGRDRLQAIWPRRHGMLAIK